MAFEHDLKKIDHRDWTTIQKKWLNYLPTIAPPGQAPQEEIADLPDIEELARSTLKKPGTLLHQELSYLRSEIFREGIFLFHKASHINSAGLMHVENGVISWSISSAYHSSFFALKSLLCLLGLSFPRVKSRKKCLMIDCFPEEGKLSSKQLKKGYQPPPLMKFLLTEDLGHLHYWEIFMRVLRTSEVSVWDDELISCLQHINPSDFSLQRNLIHYKNNYWPILIDLYSRRTDLTFACFNDYKDTSRKINSEMLDYSFFISYLLLYLSFCLIKSVTENAPILVDEFELIKKCLALDENSRLKKSLTF